MRTLLNTLYVQTQGSYLRLENENVRVDVDGERKAMLPLHHLDGVVVFGNVLLSPYLIQKLGREHKPVTWLTEWGRFTARTETPVSGNVLLRVAQHACAGDEGRTLAIARYIAAGKLQNQKTNLLRSAREAAGEDAELLPASRPRHQRPDRRAAPHADGGRGARRGGRRRPPLLRGLQPDAQDPPRLLLAGRADPPPRPRTPSTRS